jgi:hypothetical protein
VIYLASSWRNPERIDAARDALRADSHEVYDFRENEAFHWQDVDPEIQRGTGDVGDIPAARCRDLLKHSKPALGFGRDMAHLELAATVVLILPCGRSAHTEFGYAVACGKRTVVWLTDPCRPELMYSAAETVAMTLDEVRQAVAKPA